MDDPLIVISHKEELSEGQFKILKKFASDLAERLDCQVIAVDKRVEIEYKENLQPILKLLLEEQKTTNRLLKSILENQRTIKRRMS